MIITQQAKDVSICGNFGVSTNFSIKADAKAFNILSSNIYTNTFKSGIREVSTNANDAHIEAGNDANFDVHLPNLLEPWFSVRDYGTGLSQDDCMKVYTTYFHSTKTESNDFTGALGLGSKSPFCLVDSFVVQSFFNGVQSIYSAYKDEYDIPNFVLLSENDTEEPNGMYIELSIEKGLVECFEREAIEVFSYFNKVPNINNKVVENQAKSFRYSFLIRTDNYLFCDSIKESYNKHIKCVMGNVCYTLEYHTFRNEAFRNEADKNNKDEFWYDVLNKASRSGLVLNFNIGELSFNPGRETLHLNKHTINNIIKRAKHFCNNIVEQITDHVTKNAKSIFEARSLFVKFCNTFNYLDNVKDIKWQGQNLYKIKYSMPINVMKQRYTGKGFSTSQVQQFSETTTDIIGDNVTTERYSLINNFGNMYHDKPEIWLNKPKFICRLKNYLKNTNTEAFLIEECHIDELGLDKSMVQNPESLPKPKRNPSTKRVLSTSQGIRRLTKDGIRYDDNIVFDNNTTYIYIKTNRNRLISNYHSHQNVISMLSYFKSLCNVDVGNVYLLNSSFVNSRDFKSRNNFVEFDSFVDDFIRTKAANQPTKKILKKNTHINFRNLGDSKLCNCSDIKEFCKAETEAIKSTTDIEFLQLMGIPTEPIDENLIALETKYAILKFIRPYDFDEQAVIDYVNSLN